MRSATAAAPARGERPAPTAPLPAGRNVGRAKIIDDRNAKSRRQRPAIADLQGQSAPGPVDERLAVKADDSDLFALQAIGHEQGFHATSTPSCEVPLIRPIASIDGSTGGPIDDRDSDAVCADIGSQDPVD